jgi:hypothetical protein
MDPDLLRIGTKAALVYAFFLLLVRLAGKREIGHFSAVDFVVALILGDISDNVIFGEVSPTQCIVAAAVLMLVHNANSWLSRPEAGGRGGLARRPSSGYDFTFRAAHERRLGQPRESPESPQRIQ